MGGTSSGSFKVETGSIRASQQEASIPTKLTSVKALILYGTSYQNGYVHEVYYPFEPDREETFNAKLVLYNNSSQIAAQVKMFVGYVHVGLGSGAFNSYYNYILVGE